MGKQNTEPTPEPEEGKEKQRATLSGTVPSTPLKGEHLCCRMLEEECGLHVQALLPEGSGL